MHSSDCDCISYAHVFMWVHMCVHELEFSCPGNAVRHRLTFFLCSREVMLLGHFPDAIAPGSDAAVAIVQTKFNPKLVRYFVRA